MRGPLVRAQPSGEGEARVPQTAVCVSGMPSVAACVHCGPFVVLGLHILSLNDDGGILMMLLSEHRGRSTVSSSGLWQAEKYGASRKVYETSSERP